MSSDDITKQFPTEDKLDSLITLVHQLSDRIQNIDSRLESLEQKVDARLHDTRPIWESVQAQLREMSLRLDEMSLRLNEMSLRLDDVETRLDKIEGTALTTRSELRELRRDLKEHLPALK